MNIIIYFDEIRKNLILRMLKENKILVSKPTRIIYETSNSFEEEQTKFDGIATIVGKNEQVDPG